MERNREARRTTMAAMNRLLRRRQRSSSLRDTPEEDGQVDFSEAARFRERGNKRERDRDLSNRKKQRRGEGFVQSGNEEGEESSEETVDDEEEYEEDDRAAWVIPPLTTSSSSTLSHNNRRSFLPAAATTRTEKVGRQMPVWKVTEEMIGVPVPRKARSASAKRSHHEYWISDGGEVETIRPLPWYPENLAWQSNYSRMQLRKNQTLERFHEFLKQENETRNIIREEAVSMCVQHQVKKNIPIT